MECFLCGEPIHESEPRINFRNHLICSVCFRGLIPEIYNMAGMGDGGVIHIIFQSCLESENNRKRKKSLRYIKGLFNKLLHKYNFECQHCGEKEENKLTIDHIHPVSKGGDNSFDNLQILCKSCNSKKGSKII